MKSHAISVYMWKVPANTWWQFGYLIRAAMDIIYVGHNSSPCHVCDFGVYSREINSAHQDLAKASTFPCWMWATRAIALLVSLCSFLLLCSLWDVLHIFFFLIYIIQYHTYIFYMAVAHVSSFPGYQNTISQAVCVQHVCIFCNTQQQPHSTVINASY